MATIAEHVRKDGRVSFYVKFRHEKKQTSRMFDDAKGAEKFKKAVEAVGSTVAIAMLDSATSSHSVDSLFIEWLAIKRIDMTTEGHRDYERAYAKWIKPTLGWRDAELVTERDVQAWIDDTLRPGGLGAKAVAKQHALLHGMFKWASSKRVGKIANNPCTETALPKRKKRPPRGLSIPELHAVLKAGEEAGHQDAADVVAVMAGTGWRPGEVMGLVAGAVDVMPNGAVYVTMESVYRRSEGIVQDGKSEAAGRRLRVLGSGAAVVQRRIVGKGVGDPVFPHPNPGRGKGAARDAEGKVIVRPWPPANFSRNHWPKIVEAAGLKERGPTPYWLRHTHVALCHAAGLTLPEIQRRIGHESIQTTIDVYGRLIDGMTDESADRLDALLTPPRSPVAIEGEVVQVAAVGSARGWPPGSSASPSGSPAT
ncbi:tyrosine-type recombinase/integrase [Nocardioides sp. Bht2]|uniref:tyrosine-type recombinase/integrase n=1 Tax=Nocardioides sp. Bht2 TaxID=3392297 RepID=UPI0039B551DA